jgi:hypothetical protein
VNTTGEVSYRANFVDPLKNEILLNVPRETVGPTFRWHPDTEHLQVGLQGQHRSYRAAARDAAQNGIDAEELFKIGAALSSPTVTLEDLTQMRKRLADTIVLWDTGKTSDQHGLGKNMLPSYELSNEHVTLANTVKNVDGARFPGSSAELATLDKLLAEYAKIGEILRQMYAVRMSYQADSADNVLECIIRARAVDDDDFSAASARERTAALTEAQTDLVFIKDQIMAMSALFKALYLALPGILAARVLPDSTAKGIERETSTLVSVGEVQKIKHRAELRAGYTTASSASSSSKATKSKYTAEERKEYAKKKTKSKSKTPVSIRPPATPASRGAEESAERTRQQKKNDSQRRNKKAQKRQAAVDSADDSGDDGDRDAGSSIPPAGGGRGGGGSGGGSSGKRGGGKHPGKPGSDKHRHKGKKTRSN